MQNKKNGQKVNGKWSHQSHDENDQLMMYISKMIWINENKNVWIDREKQSEENPNAEISDQIMSEMRILWWDDTQTQSTNVHVVMSIVCWDQEQTQSPTQKIHSLKDMKLAMSSVIRFIVETKSQVEVHILIEDIKEWQSLIHWDCAAQKRQVNCNMKKKIESTSHLLSEIVLNRETDIKKAMHVKISKQS